MNRYLIFFAAFILFSGQLYCQGQHQIDSLLRLVDNASGNKKIDLLNKLGEASITINPGKSYEYITDAVALAKELDSKEKAANSFLLFGKLYQSQAKYTKAITSFQIARSMYESIQNNEGVANAYNYIGIVNYYMASYDQALESYQKSLRIFEKIKAKEKMVKAYNNIGVVYDELRNYPKALEYYNLALTINKKINDKKGIATSFNNIGNCYYYSGDIESAIDYFQKSMDLKNEIGDTKGLANSYFNMARIYFENEKYNMALKYYEKCREIELKYGYKEGMSNTLLYLGYTFSKIGDDKKALGYFNKSLAIADSMGLLLAQKNCYSALSDLYYNMGKYEQAFDFYREFQKKKEALFNEEKHKQIAELETKYQVEKKEQEIELFESEIKRQKMVILLASGGIIVLIIFLINLFFQIRQKKKINFKLERYNKEIEGQKREITSSIEYAHRIQTAILPSQESIKKLLSDYFILYRPKDIVSGDFYWIEHITLKGQALSCNPQNTIHKTSSITYVAAVDCTGHGVPGAFMSMIGNMLLNEILSEKKIFNPSDILNELNHLVKVSLKQEQFKADNLDGMDIALCAIDQTHNKLYYSGANRNLYHLRNGELTILNADKTAIGGITADNYTFQCHEFDLLKNDIFYLFSDGYVDQFGGIKGKKFLIRQFKDTLLKINHLSMEQQKEELINTLEQWQGPHTQVDDILVIGVKI